MNLLRNPWVTGALVIAALLVVLYQVFPPHWSSPRPAPEPAASLPSVVAHPATPAKEQGVADKTAVPQMSIDRDYVMSHLAGWTDSPQHDPFQWFGGGPLQNTNLPFANLKLRGIWRQQGVSLAAINNGVYVEGDTFGGYTIKKIEDGQVWLTSANIGSVRLGFDKTEVKEYKPPIEQPESATPKPATNPPPDNRSHVE